MRYCTTYLYFALCTITQLRKRDHGKRRLGSFLCTRFHTLSSHPEEPPITRITENMRFKAKLAPEQVSLLYQLIVPISRLASSSSAGDGVATSLHRNGCVLYMDTNRLCISIKGQSTDTDGIICFAELQASQGIFLEHRIESAAENNVILMELDICQLRMALQSVTSEHRSSDSNTSSSLTGLADQNMTVLKLAKRSNIPCLCLDANNNAGSGSAVAVHHTIPVRILRPAEMQYHLPPQIPLPDVQLELTGTTAATVKTVVERLRSLSPTVHLSASMTGELTVSLDSDGASIRTFFSKLHPRPEDCKPGTDECCVKVDTKKLCASLQWQGGNSSGGSGGGGGGSGNLTAHAAAHNLVSSATLCLVENEMLIVHAVLQPAQVGFFTYYVPVHYLSSDPRDD